MEREYQNMIDTNNGESNEKLILMESRGAEMERVLQLEREVTESLRRSLDDLNGSVIDLKKMIDQKDLLLASQEEKYEEM